MRATDLKTMNTTSCGCYRKMRLRETQTKHGMARSRIYRTWVNMHERCNDSNNAVYRIYGGRGIEVCEEWRQFERFYEWANGSGYTDLLTIDRINNDGNYEPSNCRWATKRDQANNKSTNRYITYDGETLTLAETARKYNIGQELLCGRLRLNWCIAKALTQECRKRSVR